MKAMILAAGIGSRMGQLTRDRPKALIELNYIPLIEHIIRRLVHAGISEIIINVHHFADQIIEYIHDKKSFDIRIEFSHEEKLLETGGGLKKAGWFFDDDKPFVLHNVDIITGIDLSEIINNHNRLNALATLAIRHRRTSRKLLFDDEMHLVGWKSTGIGQSQIISGCESVVLKEYAFLGVHILNPEILQLMPASGRFSIITAYMQIAGQQKCIYGSVIEEGFWIDVGRPENIKIAESYLK